MPGEDKKVGRLSRREFVNLGSGIVLGGVVGGAATGRIKIGSKKEAKAMTTIQKFIGTWKLVTSEFHTADGKVTYPLGKKAVGILIYDSGGLMAAQLMRPDRPKFASGDMRGGTPEEIKAAVDGYVAYFGTYEVDDKKGTVVHHVEASLFPNWLGQDQIRFFEFSGDLLTLKTSPILSGGQEMTGVLVWKRLP